MEEDGGNSSGTGMPAKVMSDLKQKIETWVVDTDKKLKDKANKFDAEMCLRLVEILHK